VKRLNGLVSEIAGSARQQAAGLKDVNQAMTQMDQVRQQNAAMVQRATATSHSLADEAAALEILIAKFRTGTASPASQNRKPSATRQTALNAAR